MGRWQRPSYVLQQVSGNLLIVTVLPAVMNWFGQPTNLYSPLTVVLLTLVLTLALGLLPVIPTILALRALRKSFVDDARPQTIRVPVVWPPRSDLLRPVCIKTALNAAITALICFWTWRTDPVGLATILGLYALLNITSSVCAFRENTGPQGVFTLPKDVLEKARAYLDLSLRKSEVTLASAGLTKTDARRLARWLELNSR